MPPRASCLLCFTTFVSGWIFTAVSFPLEEVSVSLEDSLDTNQIEPRAIGGFKVYWNVPTFLCHQHGVNFSAVSEKWGILQNTGDKFRGNQITILYDPGEFPALLETTDGAKDEPRNGGVPQEGNLNRHLSIFKKTVEKLLLSNFKGIGIIDFEHWRPIWRENWGILDKYREYSRFIEKKLHPTWSKYNINKEAVYRFESSAKDFMYETLRLAKKLYPKARWGYYGYPFCFNYKFVNNQLPCTDEVLEDNNRLRSLFKEHTVLFPSMYLRSEGMTEKSNAQYITGRMEEAVRISKIPSNTIPIYAYTWYKYSDANRFLTKGDLLNSFSVPRQQGASGVIIWGATKDVNTREKCLAVYDYLERYLGPTVKNVLEHKQDTPVSNTSIFVDYLSNGFNYMFNG